jgi:hypothetical protein
MCACFVGEGTVSIVGRDSSVDIVTGYGLDDLVGAGFSAPVQAGPGAHPASCTMIPGLYRG